MAGSLSVAAAGCDDAISKHKRSDLDTKELSRIVFVEWQIVSTHGPT